jgi:hypothetical protein
MDPSPATVRRVTDRCLIVLFVAVLWLPLTGRLLGVELLPGLSENRPLTPLPELGWDTTQLATFPRQFDAYYGDHFGFRNLLIRCLSLARVDGLRVSSSPNVILGRRGWLFFTPEAVGADYRAVTPLTPRQLQEWQRVLEARRDWAARRGIRYLFVVAPDKQSIYPDYLPQVLQPRVQQPSRLDQLLAQLREHSDVNVVDLRPALREARRDERVYHRTDTHWNYYGAYFAYRRLAAELAGWFPSLRPLAREAVRFEREDTEGGDLAVMLGLSDRMTEHRLHLLPIQRHSTETGEEIAVPEPFRIKHLQARVTRVSEPSLPRGVLFFDSFGEPLRPFLSENFQHLVFAPEYVFDAELVERERPDVVIQLMVERKLAEDPPVDPPLEPPGQIAQGHNSPLGAKRELVLRGLDLGRTAEDARPKPGVLTLRRTGHHGHGVTTPLNRALDLWSAPDRQWAPLGRADRRGRAGGGG